MAAPKTTVSSAVSGKASRVHTCMAGCKHDAQDALHGPGQRVQNPTKDGYRCTVCGKDQN